METLAPKLGVNKNTLAAYERGERLPDVDFLALFAARTGVEFGELLTLRMRESEIAEARVAVEAMRNRMIGAPFREMESGTVSADDQPPPITGLTVHTENLADDFVLIPQYDVEAAAGAGRWPDREQVVNQLAFKAQWVRNVLGVAPDRLALITAAGDSMEPTIRHGDMLLIDLSVDRVKDDAIYLVEKWGQLIVKRVQRFISGKVVIRSDNPAYEEETVEANETHLLRIAGRVRWIARMI